MTTQVTPALAWRSAAPEASKRPSGPWPLTHFGRLLTLWLTAFIILTVASVGASTDADPTHASRWILLGPMAGLLAGGASTLWLVTGMRAVRARQQAILTRTAHLGPILEVRLGVSRVVTAQEHASVGPGGLVRVENGTRFHDADCLLVVGKPLVPVDVADYMLQPCGVCQG